MTSTTIPKQPKHFSFKKQKLYKFQNRDKKIYFLVISKVCGYEPQSLDF